MKIAILIIFILSIFMIALLGLPLFENKYNNYRIGVIISAIIGLICMCIISVI